MFFKKCFFISLYFGFFTLTFNFAGIPKDDSDSLAGATAALETMVTNFNQEFSGTLATYNDHLTIAGSLLDIIKQDLEKIQFDEASDSTTNPGVHSTSPEFMMLSALVNTLMEEDDFPQWVKRAIMTSPTLKIKKSPSNFGSDSYCAAEKKNLVSIFLLKKGDHTLWVGNESLYGYDQNGCLFIQKNFEERFCISNT